MPTVYGAVTSSTVAVLYAPPKHRKIRVETQMLYNEDVVGHKLTFYGLRLDANGNITASRVIRVTNLASGQNEIITAEKLAVYDLDKGEAFGLALEANTTSYPVHVTLTYELE